MPFAGIHAFLPYFIIEYCTRKYNLHPSLPYIAAFGGLVPDFDFLFVLLYNDITYHSLITHTLIIPLILVFLTIFIPRKYKLIALSFTFGYAFHVILDGINKGIISDLLMRIIDGVIIVIFVMYQIYLSFKTKKLNSIFN